jgi:polysaccharide export outer membrane protein
MKRFIAQWALGLSLAAIGHTQQLAGPSSTDPFQPCVAPSNEPYTLGPGDQISVDVIDNATLSGKHIVGPDGQITIGVAGSIDVAGLTREKAATDIKDALAHYYTPPPTVVVGVDVYVSNYIKVLGAVEHPGPMIFEDPPTLLSVISRAGFLAAPASPGILSSASGIPERVAIFCGDHSVAWEDFKSLLESNDPHLQMHLRKDDVVYVPSPNERYISVFGQVARPGLVQLQDGATVTQMLAEVGGILTDKSGRLPKIQIIHQYKGSVETVAYADILKPKSNQTISLQTGDIIYVPESEFSRFAVTFEKISPLISITTIGTLIAHP